MALRPAVWTTRLTTPGAGAFALLFGLEAVGRALVTTALPVQTLELVGSDEGVSLLFLIGSLVSIVVAFLVPQMVAAIGRARVCSLAILMLFAAALLFTLQSLPTQTLAFVLRATGVAVLYAVLSLFIMDHIKRRAIGRSEPLRMLSIGLAWTVGPLAGVQIQALWGPDAPFLAAGLIALLLLGQFWALRLSESPMVQPAEAPRPRNGWIGNPLVNLARLWAQPRLRLAWLHATGRTIFWKSFTIFTPLFALEIGLGAGAGGLLVSLGSGFMLFMPVWGWAARRFGIRRVSLLALPLAGAGLTGAALLAAWPVLAAASLVVAALAMTVIDGYGNALFLRACKPSQRVALTPIFSAHRDIGEILQAGGFVLLLAFFPVHQAFIALAVIFFGIALLMTRVHPRF